jgi:hypothetical protein
MERIITLIARTKDKKFNCASCLFFQRGGPWIWECTLSDTYYDVYPEDFTCLFHILREDCLFDDAKLI